MEIGIGIGKRKKGNKWQLIEEIKENKRKGRRRDKNMHAREIEEKGKEKKNKMEREHSSILFGKIEGKGEITF